MSKTKPPLTVIHSDALTGLAGLPDHSVQSIITSPPYYGLRDYSTGGMLWPEVEFQAMPGDGVFWRKTLAWTGELGSEPTMEAFIGHLVAIFRAARRVLRKDGTMWINMGDSYAGAAGGFQGKHGARASRTHTARTKTKLSPGGLAAKQLMGVPWRMAFALQADGWTLRSEIIWSKPNPMPESTKDRPTKAHEHLFLFSAGPKYFYDSEAIREQCTGGAYTKNGTADNSTLIPATLVPGNNRKSKRVPTGWDTGPGSHGTVHRSGRTGKQAGHGRRHAGFNERWEETEQAGEISETRNKRDVWEVATQGFPGAHFATYPPALIRPCVLAGSRPGDLVLDMFGGSGTTGQVALEEGRRAILIEPNAAYVKLIHARTGNITPGLGL